MPWTILDSTSYPAVRAALDVALLESNLPDATIGLDIYEEAAIQDVVNIYPTAAAETVAANQTRITRAAIYFCAARLAPAVVRITSLNVATRDMSYSRQTFDPDERAAELRALAEAELAAILEPAEETPSRPTMFTVASGTRGR
jgi:hypothetical protein